MLKGLNHWIDAVIWFFFAMLFGINVRKHVTIGNVVVIHQGLRVSGLS